MYHDEMTRATDDLLAEAFELPPEEEDVEAPSASEIQHRVSRVRAGELESTDWRTVLDRVEKDVDINPAKNG